MISKILNLNQFLETYKLEKMKRFILSLLISVIALGAFAQKGKVSSALNYIDAGNFVKAKEAIDAAVVHDKTKEWPKTFYAQGRLAQALFESGDAKLIALYNDPLVLANDSYMKSIELDDKKTMEKLVMIQLPALSNDFLTWAIKEFEAENFEKSLMAFEELIKIQEGNLYVGAVDTAVVFNAGLAAYNAKDYETAIKYFDRTIETGYAETQPFLLKFQTYSDMEDLDNAEKTLTDAFEKYPTNKDVILQLIQFYLVNEKDQDAFEYIKMAKETDPNNFSLFWAEGVLYMKQEKYPEAITALSRAIEINPEFFDTQYNLGVCYYNMASEMFDAANDIMDNVKYNAAIEEAKEVFEKAIPYMEKANELRPDDIDTMTSLRELYYRLQTKDDIYKAKFEEIKAKIEEIEG